MPTKKYVYKFAEGNKDMREILGGKGANLAEMARLGFPVPNGFTVSTEACTQYYEDGREINSEIQKQIEDLQIELTGNLEQLNNLNFKLV